MTKRLHSRKGLILWCAISALLLIAGIVVGCLLGFNYVSLQSKTVEICYDAETHIGGYGEKIEEICEKSFDGKGLHYSEKRLDAELESNTVGETGNYRLVYSFTANVDGEALKTVASDISSGISSGLESGDIKGDVSVSVQTLEGEKFTEPAWRGAIALAVAAIVALVYVGFRFGWGSAIAGLVACANDALLPLSVILLTRIPVYAYSPVLIAGIAMVISVVLWLVQCMKLRENSKDPSYATLTPEEAVSTSVCNSWKFMLWFLVPIAAVFVVFGAVATSGLRLFMLTLLLPLAVSVYSSFLLAPAVLAPIKGKLDSKKFKRKIQFKKKKQETKEEE